MVSVVIAQRNGNLNVWPAVCGMEDGNKIHNLNMGNAVNSISEEG